MSAEPAEIYDPPTWAWQDYAECVIRGVDPEAFYPLPGEPIPPEVVRACAACPVRWECLSYALAREEPDARWGIWGGYTGRGRSDMVAGRNPLPIFHISRAAYRRQGRMRRARRG